MKYLNSLHQNLKGYLDGKKTYIVSFLLVLIGLTKLYYGDISVQQLFSGESLEAILVMLNGMGLSSLRAGVKKIAGN